MYIYISSYLQFNPIQFSGYLLNFGRNSVKAENKASTKKQIKDTNGTNTQQKTLNKQNKNNMLRKNNIKGVLGQDP
jgi:hypothetical protein